MEWLLLFARDLALVLWLGGLVVIDFVEAPAKFRVREINRNQAVAVGRAVFPALNRMEVMVGAVLLAACALLARHAQVTGFGRATVAAVGVIWLIALAQFFYLRPRMSEIARDLDLVNRREGDPRYAAVKRMHRLYTALDLGKIALGLLTLALNV